MECAIIRSWKVDLGAIELLHQNRLPFHPEAK